MSTGVPGPRPERRPSAQKAFAFLSVKTQFENAGDALIVRELVRLAAGRAHTSVDLSRCPKTFRATMSLDRISDVTTYTSAGYARLLLALLRRLFTGGSCYYFLMPGGRGGEISAIAYVKSVLGDLVLGAMKLAGIRLCHVGISYDHLGPRHIRMLRRRSRLLWSHAVRDTLTRDYVQSLGIRVHAVIPDLALNVIANTDRQPAPKRTAIAFSFRRDKYPHLEAAIERFVQRALAAHERRSDVVIVSQVQRDTAFMQALAAKLAGALDHRVGHVECWSDIERCIDTYARCRTVYSNRLHVLLLAAAAGAQPIAVVTSPLDTKITGVFRYLGLEGSIISLDAAVDGMTPTSTISLRRYRDELASYFDSLLGVENTVSAGPRT